VAWQRFDHDEIIEQYLDTYRGPQEASLLSRADARTEAFNRPWTKRKSKMTDLDRRNVLQMAGAALLAGLAGCGAGIFGDGTIPNSGEDFKRINDGHRPDGLDSQNDEDIEMAQGLSADITARE
jgi:hypothetical protein